MAGDHSHSCVPVKQFDAIRWQPCIADGQQLVSLQSCCNTLHPNVVLSTVSATSKLMQAQAPPQPCLHTSKRVSLQSGVASC